MDIVKKIYENLGIDKKENPFIKKASKESSPLSHFGIRNDLDYDYEGENVDKKKEVISQSDWTQQAFEKLHRIWLRGGGDNKWVPELQKGTISGEPVLVVTFLPGGEEWAPFDASEVDTFINNINKTTTKKEAILDVLEAPNMYDHLPKRWEVIASITGLKNPEVAFNKNYDSYVNLSDRSRCALAYTKESDHKVNEWYNQLMNKKADENMTKEEAFEKLLRMISNDVRMRIKWDIEGFGEKTSAEMSEIIKRIEEIGSPDDQELVKMYHEKFASKRIAERLVEGPQTRPAVSDKPSGHRCVCGSDEVYDVGLTLSDGRKENLYRCFGCGAEYEKRGDQFVGISPGGVQGRKAQTDIKFPFYKIEGPVERRGLTYYDVIKVNGYTDSELLRSANSKPEAEAFLNYLNARHPLTQATKKTADFQEWQNTVNVSDAYNYVAEHNAAHLATWTKEEFIEEVVERLMGMLQDYHEEVQPEDIEKAVVEYINRIKAFKKTADSINDEHNTQTNDSFLESIGDQKDDGDIEKNHVHGSPFDNNRRIVEDALTGAPTPPVYAPSSSDGILFDTIGKEDPSRESPLNNDKKEFEGVNAKKAILASMQKSGQQWEYFHQALTKLKSLDGKPMLRKVFDEGYYPILQDMIAKGFAELKKIKVSGTTSQINMTPQGKLALTAVEEKIKMQNEPEKVKTETAPETVAPPAAEDDLPGQEDLSKAPTEEIPLVMPVASKKTYSINDIDGFAPHIATAMIKMGVMFVDRAGFDKKYAAYIEQVKDVPMLDDTILERKAAELEISKNAYRKISYAQQGIKVFSHDDFVEKAGIAKAKLYQYKDPGTFVKIGNDGFVVAKITDGEIFLRRAQTGFSEEENSKYQETLPENAYRNNKNCKFMVYEKKKNGEDGEKGKELGFDRSHKGARMRGIENGEGNYVVEVINEKVGPSSSNTGAPEIYGMYEFEVRKMPSGGSYPMGDDHLMVMNYRQLLVSDPSIHVTKLVKEAQVKQTSGKVLTVYPPDATNEEETLSWAFNNKSKMNFEYDDQSITDNSVRIWSNGIDEKVLQQRLNNEGIDYLISDIEPSKMHEIMQARKARVTKTAESALKALFKAFERVARDVTVGGKVFDSAEDRKFVLNLMTFIENNMEALSKIANVSKQEEQVMEQVVEEATEVVENPANVEKQTEEKVEAPVEEIKEEVKAIY